MSDAATAKQGFFDHALALRLETFGVMAHIYASYESRENQSDSKPFARGRFQREYAAPLAHGAIFAALVPAAANVRPR